MAKKTSLLSLGSWAFLIGAILALVMGVLVGLGMLQNLSSSQILVLMYVLVGLGVVIGLLNISEKESQAFLMSGVSLVIVSALGASSFSFIPIAQATLSYLLMIFVPATVIVAIKSVSTLAGN